MRTLEQQLTLIQGVGKTIQDLVSIDLLEIVRTADKDEMQKLVNMLIISPKYYDPSIDFLSFLDRRFTLV